MAVNFSDLLGVRLPNWISRHLLPSTNIGVAQKFWVEPVDKQDPSYKDLVSSGLQRLKSTKLIDDYTHESLIFLLIEDEVGKKIIVFNREQSLLPWKPSEEDIYFSTGELKFLQLAHFVEKYNIPASEEIPPQIVNQLPVFEDDLLRYFPVVYVLCVKQIASTENLNLLLVKAVLALEGHAKHIKSFREKIIELAYVIPDGHDWIFGQLISAIRAQRLVNMYLELYKLFEFFFPMNSIFGLAERLGYKDSELILLSHCKAELNWSINHQRGSRSTLSYASVAFAEICLDEIMENPSEGNVISFKEKAIDKLTKARHTLTHQDFGPAVFVESDIARLTQGLLEFLREAFIQYGVRLEERKKRHELEA